VFGGEHGKFVSVKNAVAGFLRAIAAFDQLFMPPLELFQLRLKCDSVHLAWAVVILVKLVVGSKILHGAESSANPESAYPDIAADSLSPPERGSRAGAMGFELE
jgi:hypothetical protein